MTIALCSINSNLFYILKLIIISKCHWNNIKSNVVSINSIILKYSR
nr:MAG TPA: hypothetical protein [Caudoviricetes sp.]